MVKKFQFLRLSTKFWAVLRLSVNPTETLLKKKENVRATVIPREFALSFRNFAEKAVPFAIESFRKFKPDFLVEWKLREILVIK